LVDLPLGKPLVDSPSNKRDKTKFIVSSESLKGSVYKTDSSEKFPSYVVVFSHEKRIKTEIGIVVVMTWTDKTINKDSTNKKTILYKIKGVDSSKTGYHLVIYRFTETENKTKEITLPFGKS